MNPNWLSPRLEEDDIRRAVAEGNIPTLLMLVFQFTGDPKWLEEPYKPTQVKGLGDHDDGGLSEGVQASIRAAAVSAILGLQDGVQPAIQVPSPQLAVRMLSVCMAEPVAEEYGPLLSSEFARRTGFDLSTADPVGPAPDFNVLVIGASVSGIIAAKYLEEMGLSYTILEKASGPGGTWRSNLYPGVGVDTPSHLYSYSFAPRDWHKHFELGAELCRYMEDVLRDLGADEHVRYNTEALSASYDTANKNWKVHLRTTDGHEESVTANAVISAVGILNSPKYPIIPGAESFGGPSFHSSNWPAELDVSGKRVAVVGTGASAMQIVPAIAHEVGECVVFQRSPQWIAPFEKFQQPIPDGVRLLLRSSPIYHGWYWLRLFWQFGDRILESLVRDPDWGHPEASMNSRNDAHRRYFTRYLKDQLEGRPDLIGKVLPHYPPFGKRILLDNGWYAAIKQANVTLVDEAVAQVRAHGVVSTSGVEYGADILVWATGFNAHRFVSSLEVIGAAGETLREAWNDDDPRAYLGISVPGFPNFFMLGGPQSFPGSGSFMFFMELQMRYIQQLLMTILKHDIAALDARADKTQDYNDTMDRAQDQMVWAHPGMDTYYRNSRGRVVFVSPFRNIEYWRMVGTVSLDDYIQISRS